MEASGLCCSSSLRGALALTRAHAPVPHFGVRPGIPEVPHLNTCRASGKAASVSSLMNISTLWLYPAALLRLSTRSPDVFRGRRHSSAQGLGHDTGAVGAARVDSSHKAANTGTNPSSCGPRGCSQRLRVISGAARHIAAPSENAGAHLLPSHRSWRPPFPVSRRRPKPRSSYYGNR